MNTTPEPPDLRRTWRDLFRGQPPDHGLWFAVLEPGLAPRGAVHVGEVPDLPDVRGLRGLVELLRELVAVSGAGASVAFCRSRPGGRRVGAADRAWALGLLRESGVAGVATWPVHLATDDGLVEVRAEDLADSA